MGISAPSLRDLVQDAAYASSAAWFSVRRGAGNVVSVLSSMAIPHWSGVGLPVMNAEPGLLVRISSAKGFPQVGREL